MKVRKDYVRQKKGSAQRLMQRCPITGQLIAAEEMSNHLKVLLLDPKWKHQKDALVERARKESAFADDVEANLASFVAKRPDLFGTVEEEIREAAEAGAEAAARDAGADAGPAHTMVPPTAPEALAAPKKAALPGTATGAALQGPGMQALPAGQQGPIAGVSTINARLPQASLANQGSAASGVKPPGMLPGTAPMALADDDDEDDEPMAKKPRLDDGSLFPEETWVTWLFDPQKVEGFICTHESQMASSSENRSTRIAWCITKPYIPWFSSANQQPTNHVQMILIINQAVSPIVSWLL